MWNIARESRAILQSGHPRQPLPKEHVPVSWPGGAPNLAGPARDSLRTARSWGFGCTSSLILLGFGPSCLETDLGERDSRSRDAFSASEPCRRGRYSCGGSTREGSLACCRGRMIGSGSFGWVVSELRLQRQPCEMRLPRGSALGGL